MAKVTAVVTYPVYVEMELGDHYDLDEELHREDLINEIKDEADRLFNKSSIEPEIVSLLVDDEPVDIFDTF